MERFSLFWKQFCPSLPDAPLRYIFERLTLANYPKRRVIKLPEEPLPYFCIVLEGLVGGYQTDQGGNPVLRDLIPPFDFFTGTEHPFTKRTKNIEYQALTASTVALLPIGAASEGQTLYLEIAELFHVMKQRKINQLRNLVAVYQETDHYLRYCVYRALFPNYSMSLPHHVQAQLLRMSLASYQRAKARYLHDNGK